MQGWKATLELGYDVRHHRTQLVHRRHSGPLAVQKSLHPEGAACHTVLLHPPGGIAGGDELEIDMTVAPKAHVLVTTPGATKWYRSTGTAARQKITLRLAEGGVLEYLPQETLLFDGARGANDLQVELARDSRYLGWDITALGRPASAEPFKAGHLTQHCTITHASQLLLCERLVIEGGDPLLTSRLGLQGHRVLGTLIAAGSGLKRSWLYPLRATACDGALCGLTLLPDVLVARYLGDTTEAARRWFETLWATLRPLWLDLPACPPRIWST